MMIEHFEELEPAFIWDTTFIHALMWEMLPKHTWDCHTGWLRPHHARH